MIPGQKFVTNTENLCRQQSSPVFWFPQFSVSRDCGLLNRNVSDCSLLGYRQSYREDSELRLE